MRSLGIEVQLFGSISEFLESDPPDGPSCLVLDVRLPGQSGLDLQRELVATKREIPIIFITGHGDIPMSVQAMKGGAIEFLTKPFRDQDLLDAIQLGLSRDRARRENEKEMAALQGAFRLAKPEGARDRDSGGARPPQQTDCLRYWDRRSDGKGASQRAMQKMKAGSLPELGRMADKLKLTLEESQRS